jgi:hypothetical protein
MKYTRALTVAWVVLVLGCPGVESVDEGAADQQVEGRAESVSANVPVATSACCMVSGCEELSSNECAAIGGFRQPESVCAHVDCAARVNGSSSVGPWGACCLVKRRQCGEASEEECSVLGGSFYDSENCEDVCPGFGFYYGEPNEPSESVGNDALCCVGSVDACFEADREYCVIELRGSIVSSCEEGCPELEDQSESKAACCFQGRWCKDLSPALCAIEGGLRVEGEACGVGVCGE